MEWWIDLKLWLKHILRLIISLSLLWCLPCLLLSSATCSAASEETQLTLTQEQSTQLLNLLQTQETLLDEVMDSLNEAQTALNDSDSQLIECQNDLAAAQAELAKQKKEIATLKTTLLQLRKELATASISIANANKSLQQAKEEMIANDKKHQQKENSLRGDRTFWEIICCLLGGICIVK